jgi:hypothetical protein
LLFERILLLVGKYNEGWNINASGVETTTVAVQDVALAIAIEVMSLSSQMIRRK